MENASKALLMAAGVLIGILVLSLAVYLFITFGASSREINARIEDAQLTKFNAQFNVYADRDDITIYDIISLANLAEENNNYYKSYGDFESDYKIIIKLENVELQKAAKDYRYYLLKNNNNINESGEIKDLYSSKKTDGGHIKYNDKGRVSELRFVKK